MRLVIRLALVPITLCLLAAGCARSRTRQSTDEADLSKTCKTNQSECTKPQSHSTPEVADSAVVPDAGHSSPHQMIEMPHDTGTMNARDAAPVEVDATGPPVNTRHPQCKQPLPDMLPSLPPINPGPGGRPAFSQWQDVSCDEAKTMASLCPEWTGSSISPGACGSCLHARSDDDGVCTYGDVDIWCDGEGQVMGLAPGCWICSPPEVHARACCEGLDVDCRTWPFPGDSARGMICARHEDCEPGLICGAPDGSGYGICRCPEEGPVKWTPECNDLIVFQ